MFGLRNLRAARIVRGGFILMLAGLFTALFVIVGPDILRTIHYNLGGQPSNYWNPVSPVALPLAGMLLGAGLASFLWKFFGSAFGRWEKMDVGDKVTLFLGIFAGLVASLPFLFLFNSVLPAPHIPLALIGLLMGFAALSVYALQSMGDVLPWTRGKGRKRRGIKILDTNVIIDGRVYDVAR